METKVREQCRGGEWKGMGMTPEMLCAGRVSENVKVRLGEVKM